MKLLISSHYSEFDMSGAFVFGAVVAALVIFFAVLGLVAYDQHKAERRKQAMLDYEQELLNRKRAAAPEIFDAEFVQESTSLARRPSTNRQPALQNIQQRRLK